jgi:hypothetical protein
MEQENFLKIIDSMKSQREENESENESLIKENRDLKSQIKDLKNDLLTAYEKNKYLEDAGLYYQKNIQTKEIQLNQVREKNLLLIKEILELKIISLLFYFSFYK